MPPPPIHRPRRDLHLRALKADDWHTFWNTGDEECRFVELIAPAGLEAMFKEMGADPEAMASEAVAGGAHACPFQRERRTRLVLHQPKAKAVPARELAADTGPLLGERSS